MLGKGHTAEVWNGMTWQQRSRHRSFIIPSSDRSEPGDEAGTYDKASLYTNL